MAYRLTPTARVDREVRRVAHERLTEAIGELDAIAHDGADVDEAIHTVRKRCKETRALARLVRPHLGNQYRTFDREVRDAARALAALRDAHAVLATFEHLRQTAAHPDDPSLMAVRADRMAIADAARSGLGPDDPRLRQARARLARADAMVDGWRLPRGFGALSEGLADTYRRGRRDLKRLRDHLDDDLAEHEWRTTAKRLWYQLRLLERAAPSVLGPLVAQLDDLGEALGDDHDLSVLVERLHHPTTEIVPEQADVAIELARARQRDLRDRAIRLGATIYAEPPDAFVDRMRRYWRLARRLGGERTVGGLAGLVPNDQQFDVAADDEPGSDAASLVERERKFLVPEPPPHERRGAGVELRQGYLAIDGSTSVRVRQSSGDGATLTVKAGGGPVRTELEWPISDEAFEAAWAHTGGRRIRKQRHRIEIADRPGLVAELDVFADQLDGLVLVEVEFADDREMADFEPPDWFGREVSDDRRFTNAQLAIQGVPEGIEA